jgi:hypothetical protein
MAEVEVSTWDASAVTSTLSLIAPTVREKFTVTSPPTVTTRPPRTSVLKPGAEVLISYDPAGILAIRYSPLSLEVVLRIAPVSRLRAETSALAITPPC